MAKSITVLRKKRGRPATGVDPQMCARMEPELIQQVEAWAASQRVSRSEAIRRLVQRGLSADVEAPNIRKAPPAPPTQQLAGKSPRAIKGRKRKPDALPGG